MSTAKNPTSSHELRDQAAAAALYVTEPQRGVRDPRSDPNWPLDANGKLTSASAATSLKHADARQLPSFPSVGIESSAAGGAALLANKNTKSPEWWKPDASAGASKAAMRAKDYKMDPLWQPESSAAGSKAALLAAQRGAGLNLWEPAASEKALMAAKGAASGKLGRPVREPTAQELGIDRYPDEKNAAKNALSAANAMSKAASVRSRNQDLGGLTDDEAERIRKEATVNMHDRHLFGSNPLIGPELDERNHQAGLHAAAVSMAQGMYGKRDKAYREKIDLARSGSRAATGRTYDDDSDDEPTPMSFMGLHEAAQKLANERLAKMEEPADPYREHYGVAQSPPPSKNRLSMFGGSQRRRDSDDTDEKNSRRIRGEMNLFNDKLKEIDDRKRKDDRDALLVAAQRNVQARIAGMDEDVFQRTGKMSPAMKAEWEEKARARAQSESEQRNANYGKVGIGGGKYMDQTEIDAIAQARLQPTLDAITAKAEHDREVDEQHRQDEAEKKRIDAEHKEEERYKNTMIKSKWQEFRGEEKAEEKARKQAEREAASYSKMNEKFHEHKSKDEERMLKEEEKEHDRKIAEEWKALKRQEKEEERARKERVKASRGSLLSGLFRGRSKKEKEPKQPKEKEAVVEKKEDPSETLVPAGHGTTTTTITAEPAQPVEPVIVTEPSTTTSTPTPAPAAEPAEPLAVETGDAPTAEPAEPPVVETEDAPTAETADTPAVETEDAPAAATEDALAVETKDAPAAATEDTPAVETPDTPAVAEAVAATTAADETTTTDPAPHDKEERHNPLTAVEDTPETVAANQQKPGGGLLNKLKKKNKNKHDAKPAPVTGGGATAATVHPALVHEEPHHNPLMPVEQTPEALAANQQKPGGDLFQVLKAKKHEHEEKKRLSKVDPDAAAAATAAHNDSKEKPAIAEPVATEAAPEHVVPEQVGNGHAVEPINTMAGATATPSTPPRVSGEHGDLSTNAKEIADRVVSSPDKAVSREPEFTVPPTDAAPPEIGNFYTHTTDVGPSGHSGMTAVSFDPTTSKAPMAPATGYDTTITDTVARVNEATEGSSPTPAHETSTVGRALDSEVDDVPAMGSDKPVTHEVNHSIIDKLDARVNVGKPGFEGSEKMASVFADMRGTDHAGAQDNHTSGAPATVAVDAPAADKATAPTETTQTTSAAPSNTMSGAQSSDNTTPQQQTSSSADQHAQQTPAAATTEGQQHHMPLEKRIEVPKSAASAAAAATDKEGFHGTPRAKEKQQGRLSAFFKSKVPGKKIKQHRGSDGVTVTPTTEYTTKGKYVDPENKHTGTNNAVTPANTAALESHNDKHDDIAVDPEYSGTGPQEPVSPLSEDGAKGKLGDYSDEARDKFDGDQLPVPKVPTQGRSSESLGRETRFKEEI